MTVVVLGDAVVLSSTGKHSAIIRPVTHTHTWVNQMAVQYVVGGNDNYNHNRRYSSPTFTSLLQPGRDN